MSNINDKSPFLQKLLYEYILPFASYTNKSVYEKFRLFWIIFYCIMICVNLLIYQYLTELEHKQCECSNKYRTELMNFIPVKIFFMVLEILSLWLSTELFYANIFNFIATSLSWFVHFPLSVLFLWNTNGRADPCDCARDWKEYLTYICFF